MKKIPKHNSNKRQRHKCTNRCALHLYRNKYNNTNNQKSCRYLSARRSFDTCPAIRVFRKHRKHRRTLKLEKDEEKRKKCSVLLCNRFEPEAIGPTRHCCDCCHRNPLEKFNYFKYLVHETSEGKATGTVTAIATGKQITCVRLYANYKANIIA